MSLEQVEQLLKKHRIAPNRLLGQNFMVEPGLYPKLCTYAALNQLDIVLDAGAGFGFLARFISEKCKQVIAVEKDPQVASVLAEQVKDLKNVTVIAGDVLKVELPAFNKVIALPPYYLSTHLVTWLLMKEIDCALLVVQKEFAQRLVAPIGTEDYSWLTVVTCLMAEAKLLEVVPKEMFFPTPEVDSVILSLRLYQKKPFEVKNPVMFMRLAKSLFTERNKKLAKALLPFLRTSLKFNKKEAELFAKSLPFQDKRVRELSPQDFGEIANGLPD